MKKILSIIFLVLSLALLSSVAFAESELETEDDSESSSSEQTNTENTEADTESPTAVTNVKGSVDGTNVILTWDPATDNVGVTGYGIGYGTQTITQDNNKFDNNIKIDNVTEYTFSDLEAGNTYYFAMYAIDAAGKESTSWSNIEAVEIPQNESENSEETSSEDDNESPSVESVESLNKEEVKVVFSEEIVLPTENAQDAFNIENTDQVIMLQINSAEIDETDEEKKTVIISTEDQELNVNYKLTVSISVKDKAGNPIVSGTADTGSFKGTDTEKGEPVNTDGPVIVEIEALNDRTFLVTFNETIVLGINPEANFKLTKTDDENANLAIRSVQLVPGENGQASAAVIQTDLQEEVNYTLTLIEVADVDGNISSGEGSAYSFNGIASREEQTEEDTTEEKEEDSTEEKEEDSTEEKEEDSTEEKEEDSTPPLEIKDLEAIIALENQKYIVKLNWNLPSDDAIKQYIYMSTNDKDYDKEGELSADKDDYESDELSYGEYYFKITREDAAGNESDGTVIKVILSETGPGLAGLLIASIGLGRIVGRKRR